MSKQMRKIVCKQDNLSRWSARSAVSLPSELLCHFCQLSQRKIMSPPVAALGQCCLAAQQDMLEACIDDIAKGTQRDPQTIGEGFRDRAGCHGWI